MAFVPEGHGIFVALTVNVNLRIGMLGDMAASEERLRRVLNLFRAFEE